MATEKPLIEKAQALRLSAEIGCSGAHQAENGGWLPCSSDLELQRVSQMAETSKWRTAVPGYKKDKKLLRTAGKRKRNRAEWEQLIERPVRGLATIDGGGIVSGASFSGKSEGPEFVRDNDQDVFLDPESAKARSRQLGCIGISRRVSKAGRTVWMPCTNMSDYSNRTGMTSLGRRNINKRRENETREAVRTVLREKPKATLKRKVSIANELLGK